MTGWYESRYEETHEPPTSFLYPTVEFERSDKDELEKLAKIEPETVYKLLDWQSEDVKHFAEKLNEVEKPPEPHYSYM